MLVEASFLLLIGAGLLTLVPLFTFGEEVLSLEVGILEYGGLALRNSYFGCGGGKFFFMLLGD